MFLFVSHVLFIYLNRLCIHKQDIYSYISKDFKTSNVNSDIEKKRSKYYIEKYCYIAIGTFKKKNLKRCDLYFLLLKLLNFSQIYTFFIKTIIKVITFSYMWFLSVVLLDFNSFSQQDIE